MSDDRGWIDRSLQVGGDLIAGSPWRVERLHGTGGGQHTSAVARLRSGDRSVIVKAVRRNDASPDDPTSWRREFDAYRSDWLRGTIGPGLALPRLRAATETPEAAVMVLDDVPFDDRDARASDWYAELAGRLARMAAAPADDAPGWASAGFVRAELDALAAAAPDLTTRPAPRIAAIIDEWRSLLDRIVAIRAPLVAWLDDGPQGFGHLDAFSRNAARVGDDMVMIDWAYSGIAPLGADAAGIVAMNAMHGDIPTGGLAALYDAVVDTYVDAASTMRPTLDRERLRLAIETLITARWTAFLAQVNAAGDAIDEIAIDVTGRPLAQVMDAWTELSMLVRPLAESAVARFEG